MNLCNAGSILSAFLLGIFTKSMTDDSVAIAQCREDLLDLDRVLEDWDITNSARSNTYDIDQIKQVKKTLRLLTIHYAGLFITYPILKKFNDDSLNRIREYEKNSYEPQNIPSFVGLDLIEKWKRSKDAIWNFVNGNIIKRIWIRFKKIIIIIMLF